jgi:hypothetical protein
MDKFFYYKDIPFSVCSEHDCSIGVTLCQICHTNFSTQLKPLHRFKFNGMIICNDNTCIVSAEKQIDDFFTRYPIYNLNLNRDNIKSPKYDYITWSTMKPNRLDYLYFSEECIGSTYLIKDNFYIILCDGDISSWTYCTVFDLKEIYEANDFSNEEIVSFPDPVKEYLGIPLNSNAYQLHFVD